MTDPRPCAFCAIVRGEAAAQTVYEDDATIGFLDRGPLAIGHCLLIPRAHVATIHEADASTLTALALASKALASAVTRAMAAEGVFLAQNNVISQSVPHLHTHIVPRWKGDGLFSPRIIWKRVKYEGPEHLAEVAERIRTAVATA